MLSISFILRSTLTNRSLGTDFILAKRRLNSIGEDGKDDNRVLRYKWPRYRVFDENANLEACFERAASWLLHRVTGRSYILSFMKYTSSFSIVGGPLMASLEDMMAFATPKRMVYGPQGPGQGHSTSLSHGTRILGPVTIRAPGIVIRKENPAFLLKVNESGRVPAQA